MCYVAALPSIDEKGLKVYCAFVLADSENEDDLGLLLRKFNGFRNPRKDTIWEVQYGGPKLPNATTIKMQL